MSPKRVVFLVEYAERVIDDADLLQTLLDQDGVLKVSSYTGEENEEA